MTLFNECVFAAHISSGGAKQQVEFVFNVLRKYGVPVDQLDNARMEPANIFRSNEDDHWRIVANDEATE